MTKEEHITGQWWLPETPTEVWTGTLTVAPKSGPRLKLVVPKPFWGFDKRPKPTVIQGHDIGGAPITLLFPGYAGGPSGMAISQPTFNAGYAIHGISLAGPAEFNVNTLTVKLQHLHAWTELSGIHRAPFQTDGEIVIRYKAPAALTYRISSTLDVEFYAAHSAHGGYQEQSITEDASITFKSAAGLSFNECLKLVNSIRQLLHFASLNRVYPTEISAWKKNHGLEHEGRIIETEIKLYGSILRPPVEQEFQADRWLFRLSDIKADFANFFSKWLAFLEKYKEAISCYSATIHHTFPSEMEFLCLAQALEAYDGVRRGRQNFLDRVETLTAFCLPHLSGLVPNAKDFALTVRDNRNFFTHHDPQIRTQGRVMSGAALIRLNEKIRMMFQICVLSELGIPADRFGRLRKIFANEIVDYVTP